MSGGVRTVELSPVGLTQPIFGGSFEPAGEKLVSEPQFQRGRSHVIYRQTMNLRTLSILCATVFATAAHANLLVNGGFEIGVADPTQAGFTADGWTFTPTAQYACRAVTANGYLNDGPATGSHPGRILVFNASDTPGGSAARQSFGSSMGTTYALSLELAQYRGSLGDQRLTAIITDDSTSSTVATYAFPFPIGSNDIGNSYTTQGFSFMGTGNSLTLTLTDAGSNTVSTDMFVENVSIEAVPEPASLFALGAGAITLIRRRRSR